MPLDGTPRPSPPARVVVLGARGFVGRCVTRLLEAEQAPFLAVSSSDVDLCAPESVEALRRVIRRDDAVVFVSALTPDRGRDIRTLMRNLAMGEHVCAALADVHCAHIVYISSDAVYSDLANPVREASCCSPSSFHGVMHLARERMLEETTRRAALPLAVLRPSVLYGADDTHNSYGPNRFFRTAIADRKITLFGNGEEKRDHVYVEDVARLVWLCLVRRYAGVINVATGKSHSFLEIASKIRGLCGDHVEVQSLPRSTPITHRHFDTTAAIGEFSSFHYTDLEGGLAETWRRLPAVRSC